MSFHQGRCKSTIWEFILILRDFFSCVEKFFGRSRTSGRSRIVFCLSRIFLAVENFFVGREFSGQSRIVFVGREFSGYSRILFSVIVCKAYETFHDKDPIPTRYLREMLGVILTENSFAHGVAMGTKTAVSFASVFTAEIETNLLGKKQHQAQRMETLHWWRFLSMGL